MGCDIHIVLERRKIEGGRWVGVYCTDELPSRRSVIAQRDYAFFAEVANVRGSSSASGFYPKNLPEDVSELAWQQYMRSPTDHHSPSHLSVKDFTDAWLRANPAERIGRKEDVRVDFAAYDLLGVFDTEDRFEHRVVFWFDN